MGLLGRNISVALVGTFLKPVEFPVSGSQNGSLRVGGTAIGLIKLLAAIFGFKISIVRSGREAFGICKNNGLNFTCTGLRRLVMSGEADITARKFTAPFSAMFGQQMMQSVAHSRRVGRGEGWKSDLKQKIWSCRSVFCRNCHHRCLQTYRKISEVSSGLLFAPFTRAVWAVFFAMVAGVFVIGAGMSFLQGKSTIEKGTHSVWDLVCVSLLQPTQNSQSTPIHAVMGCFCFLMFQVYTARLYPVLSQLRTELPFTNSAGLAKLIREGKAEWIMPKFWIKGGIWSDISRTKWDNPQNAELFAAIRDYDLPKRGYSDYEEARKLLLEPTQRIRFFFHVDEIVQYLRKEECGLSTIRFVAPYNTVRFLAFNKKFPYKEEINRALLTFTDNTVADIVNQLRRSEAPIRPTSCGAVCHYLTVDDDLLQ